MKSLLTLFLILSPLAGYGASQMLELQPTLAEESSHSDIHGILDICVKNDYVTPRGLLVTNTGVTFQVLGIFQWDIFSNPDCLINKATVFAGVWNDIWSEQGDPYVGAWNECDWLAGFTVQFANNWKFGAQVIPFISPPHHFQLEDNLEFLLAYDDSDWEYPITINPYVKWFWAMSGDSTVVTGKRGGTYDVEFGMIPTYQWSCYKLMAPTWITAGPAEFWNGGSPAFKNDKKNLGVFSTGLRAECALSWVPARLGKWSVYLNGQYYHLINKNLLLAQTVTLEIPYHKTHRDIGVACAGIAFGF